MQTRQTCGNRSQHSLTRNLALICMLALGQVIGCDEQEVPSNPPQEPADMNGFTAPVVIAPEGVRIPGEYVVIFADGIGRDSIDAAASRIARAGGENQIMHRYSVIPGFAARLDEAALTWLRRNPGVAYIEENQKVWLNIAYPSPAGGIDRVDQRLGRDGMYNDHGRTGAGVHVYILDTGINSQHAEFTGRLSGGFTAIPDGRATEDCHGHGTHVASTASGTVYGMAKQATIHPVRVLDCTGVGSWAGVIAGVDFVRNDCPRQNAPCVASMSLGGGLTAAVNTAVANAVDSGVTVVVAAGNANRDACLVSPAGEPKAITVGAIGTEDKRAAFSNWGACVDIFAPGINILGAWIGGATATRTIDGTSMASPHVAGAAALYLSSNPRATPAQVEVYLKGAASLGCVGDPKGSPNVLLFTDLNQGNYYCGDQSASCQELCGGAGNGCFCDPSCEIYNDCCADYAQVCK